ncbi:hypothetical protein BpHYR1_009299 [Brachionus plicatilis]|uniref:Uncharacterized protein n=1 Tax=Brachionus plicatilis TaxID=10195 RepID=A0A3M7S764_BRAPC|nr:hypothetical protein BpHYR1_009299 [Brachionus plicatilis]
MMQHTWLHQLSESVNVIINQFFFNFQIIKINKNKHLKSGHIDYGIKCSQKNVMIGIIFSISIIKINLKKLYFFNFIFNACSCVKSNQLQRHSIFNFVNGPKAGAFKQTCLQTFLIINPVHKVVKQKAHNWIHSHMVHRIRQKIRLENSFNIFKLEGVICKADSVNSII